MIMHEITLDGYAAQCAEQPIRLGTEGSYGVEKLRVMRKGEWVNYDIIIAFHPPKGDAVQIRLGSDNAVSVPAEATAVAGTGELTFAGYMDGVRQISVSQIYRVAATAGVSGTAPAEPTPDIVQQILSAASNAEEIAQSVRDDADAGKFNGPQGPKGDTGPAVALDTTLTHEGEAADAKATGDAISAVKERLDEIPKIDDTTISSDAPWSSKQIIDTLCPPLEETGNPVVCYPVAGYPLDVTVSWGPTQEGSGTPSPENIRPIKGRDSVTITRQEDNQVITLTLPETVYGGEVDAVTGEGQETWKTLTLDGTGKWQAQPTATPGKFGFVFKVPGIATPENPGIKGDIVCSQYPAVTANDTYICKNGISVEAQENYYLRIYDDTHSGETTDEWKSYLAARYAAGTPVQVCYKLKEPVPFTATGAQPIPALSGTNTLLTDADSVSVSGRADLIHIIK